MKICIVGTGYVGLVTGVGFAETGASVICADVDSAKIKSLTEGKIPIFEPGLEELVERNVQERRLSFSDKVAEAIADANVTFVAVGTPSRSDGSADLSAVEDVARTVSQSSTRECVLVLKSTVPVGTNARVRAIVKGNSKYPIHVVSNPEFLKEGDAVRDFLRPDRIVVGCDSDDSFAKQIMSRLYHPVCLDRDRILWMDPASAELTKYVANTMLAMRISFMNEVAALCDRVGGDIHQVRIGVGSDPRIGSQFLYAGPGYGGSCFPKDVQALVHTASEHGVALELAAATHRINDRQKTVLFSKLKRFFEGSLKGKRVAVWGIAFKPRTDDIREAPSLSLIDALIGEGAEVVAHDPIVRHGIQERYGSRVKLVEDAYEAADQADALVLLTEWRQYQNPQFERLKSLMKRPALFDGRNVWSEYGLRKQGFVYEGIGVKGS